MMKLLIAIEVVMLLVASFVWGRYTGIHNERALHLVFATQPDDCQYANRIASSWTMQLKFKGGIENGGLSGPIEIVCVIPHRIGEEQ